MPANSRWLYVQPQRNAVAAATRRPTEVYHASAYMKKRISVCAGNPSCSGLLLQNLWRVSAIKNSSFVEIRQLVASLECRFSTVHRNWILH